MRPKWPIFDLCVMYAKACQRDRVSRRDHVDMRMSVHRRRFVGWWSVGWGGLNLFSNEPCSKKNSIIFWSFVMCVVFFRRPRRAIVLSV